MRWNVAKIVYCRRHEFLTKKDIHDSNQAKRKTTIIPCDLDTLFVAAVQALGHEARRQTTVKLSVAGLDGIFKPAKDRRTAAAAAAAAAAAIAAVRR